MKRLRRAAVVGLGLVGGSIAKALKAARPGILLSGVDIEPRLETPAASGFFHALRPPEQGREAVVDADLVFLCAPVQANLELLSRIRQDVRPDALVTDVGGLKAGICKAAAALFREPDGPCFVGGHPMAGKESSGFSNSSKDLFRGHTWVLTPSSRAPAEEVQDLADLLAQFGAIVRTMTPEEHDRAVVVASQLPQLAAVALMCSAGGRTGGIAGPGLRGMVRLAGSPGALWDPLLSATAAAAAEELKRLREELLAMETALRQGGPLREWFDRANRLKTELE